MATRVKTDWVQGAQLQRLAQVAGEAFGMAEIEREGPSGLRSQMLRFGTVASAVICLVAAAAVYTNI